jgi:hypothetical protein
MRNRTFLARKGSIQKQRVMTNRTLPTGLALFPRHPPFSCGIAYVCCSPYEPTARTVTEKDVEATEKKDNKTRMSPVILLPQHTQNECSNVQGCMRGLVLKVRH